MSDRAVAGEIIRRSEALKTERSLWETGWQQISDFVIGRRPNFSRRAPTLGGGQLKNTIYDGTGMQSAQLFISVVSSLLTNPASKWFLLTTADRDLMQDDDVKKWIEEAQEHLMFTFNRAQASFQTQTHEMYTDLINYGTGAISVLDDPVDGLYLRSHPLSEIYIDENSRGHVDTVYRSFEMKARQVEQEYPGASPTALALIKRKDYVTKLEIIQAIFPNTDAHLPGFENKPLTSVHVLARDAKSGEGEILRTSGFFEMPTLTPRWEKESHERYGRSPGWQALPDSKVAQIMSKTLTTAGQKAVDPPVMVSDRSQVSALRLHAAGVMSVRYDGSNQPPIQYLESRARFPIGAELIRARQVSIERAYHADILEVFRQPNMTATQVLQLVQQVERILSPVLGRQQDEWLEPLVSRAFAVEFRAGRMPEPPAILEGRDIIVEYQSPVARAQNDNELKALQAGMGVAIEMASAIPEVLDNFDTDEIARESW